MGGGGALIAILSVLEGYNHTVTTIKLYSVKIKFTPLTPDAIKFTKYASKEEILGLVFRSLRATCQIEEGH